MELLIGEAELRKILQAGLTKGLWSIEQFNHGHHPWALPDADFLRDHPQFLDRKFRDMTAFHRTSRLGWSPFSNTRRPDYRSHFSD